MSLDKVELFINNYPIQNVSSYSLRYDIFQCCASFDADIDRDYIIPLSKTPVSFQWKINGVPMMRGFLDRVHKIYNKGTFVQTVSGRDMGQVLVDSCFTSFKVPLENKTVKQIIDLLKLDIKKVMEVKNSPSLALPAIDLKVTAKAQKMIDRLGVIKICRKNPGQTFFEYLSTQINPIGLICYHITGPGTDKGPDTILIHALTQPGEQLVSYNFDGTPDNVNDLYRIRNSAPSNPANIDTAQNNVIKCEFSHDITSYYKYTQILGQVQSETLNTTGDLESYTSNIPIIKVESDSALLGYTGVTKFFTQAVTALSSEIFTKTSDLFINNLLLQQNRKLFNIKYTVAGHSQDGGTTPYYLNHVVSVQDDFIPFSGQIMITYGVEFQGSKDKGMTTTLTLGLPTSSNQIMDGNYKKLIPGQSKLSNSLGYIPSGTGI
jgi:hypothetical protein